MKFYPQVPIYLQGKVLECTDQQLVLHTPAKFWQREEFVIIKPDQVIITASLTNHDHAVIHPLTRHHRAIRFVKHYEESGSDYYVSITDGQKWIIFARKWKSREHEWVILRINELLGKRLRDVCPQCGTMLKVSQVDFTAGTMSCGNCAWSSQVPSPGDDDVNDPESLLLKSGKPLILERNLEEQDEFQVLLDPPPAITVLRASVNVLRLKIRPHRVIAIGCGTVLLLLLMMPVAMLVNVKFPDNLVASAIGIGIISLIALLVYNPVFASTIINIDRQSNVFSLSEGFSSRRTTLTPQTKLILCPQQHHLMDSQVIEVINQDEASWERLYLYNPGKFLKLELVPNQSSTTKRWLHKVLQLYLEETLHPRSLLPETTSEVESAISTALNLKHAEINKDPDQLRPLNESVPNQSALADQCPKCGEEITPSMFNLNTMNARCPRIFSCGWGSVYDQLPPRSSIEKIPWMKRLLRLIEDYLVLKK